MQQREELMERAAKTRNFTVVIIGAGINGAGVFRDLALQGLDCLIVDKGDFCAGASGASSRTIFGGLKYLETGELRLVAEATLERNRLIRNAPHVVLPLETVVPLYSWFGGTVAAVKRFFGGTATLGGRGALIVKLGLIIFDFFGRRERATPRSRLLSRGDLLRSLPAIDRGVVAGASFVDACITQPERLGLELVLDAMSTSKDCIGLNYVRLLSTDDGILRLCDDIGGQAFDVEPKIVVNAAGAWIDKANEVMRISGRYMGGTKGSHLVLDHRSLHDQLAGRLVSFDGADGRECFVYPLLDKALLGSTDLYIDNSDEARCEGYETDYLLEALRAAFPTMDVGQDNVIFAYSGVRPLPYVGTSDPSQVTRDHRIRIDEPSAGRPYPVLSLVGGKWTTFRAFAEETTNAVLGRLGCTRQTSTRDLPIGGGRHFPEDVATLNVSLDHLVSQFHIPKPRARTLIERYGSKAPAVAAYCNESADRQIGLHGGHTVREIAYLAGHEMVGRALDILLRRTTIAISGQATAALVEEIAEIAGSVLGWERPRVKSEVSLTTAELLNHHGVDLCLRKERCC